MLPRLRQQIVDATTGDDLLSYAVVDWQVAFASALPAASSKISGTRTVLSIRSDLADYIIDQKSLTSRRAS